VSKHACQPEDVTPVELVTRFMDRNASAFMELDSQLSKARIPSGAAGNIAAGIAFGKMLAAREIARSAVSPYNDNCASMVPEACQECMVGDSERELRAGLAELVKWVAANGLSDSTFDAVWVKLTELGLLADKDVTP